MRPARPFIKIAILLFIGIGIFDKLYEYFLVHILKTEIPIPVISQMMKTTENIFVIALGIFLGCIIIPILEEFIFRGFFYQAFKKQAGVIGGIIFSSFVCNFKIKLSDSASSTDVLTTS